MPGAVLKKLIDRFGGRGGGKGAMAQGGGLVRRAGRDSRQQIREQIKSATRI